MPAEIRYSRADYRLYSRFRGLLTEFLFCDCRLRGVLWELCANSTCGILPLHQQCLSCLGAGLPRQKMKAEMLVLGPADFGEGWHNNHHARPLQRYMDGVGMRWIFGIRYSPNGGSACLEGVLNRGPDQSGTQTLRTWIPQVLAPQAGL